GARRGRGRESGRHPAARRGSRRRPRGAPPPGCPRARPPPGPRPPGSVPPRTRPPSSSSRMSDPSATATQRSPDLVLARLHLRLGSLSLARAELETLAGKDMLDAEGVVDLAEVRWRTGDIVGAGEAAALVIDDDEGPVLALIVAAEAAAARGRPSEARRLAAKVLAISDGLIDAIFAGLPRAARGPPDPAAPAPSPTTMFDSPHPGRGTGGRRARSTAGPSAADGA